MGRMIKCEVKRILSSRSTMIALLVAVAISIVFSFLVISFENYYYMDEDNKVVELTGFKAIKAKKDNQDLLTGELTGEKIRAAYEKYVAVCSQYGENIDDVPLDIYYRELYSFEPLLSKIMSVYLNSSTKYISDLDVSDNMFDQYYEDREAFIYEYIDDRYGEMAVNTAEQLLSHTETPYIYEYGLSANAIDYIGLLQWVIICVSIVIIVPTFSMGYQTQADDICRTAKNGRKRLAIVKILSSLIIVIPLYLVCIGVYLMIMNIAFGWSGLENSGQMLLSISIVPFNVGEIVLALFISGFITTIAVCSFALLASAFRKTQISALIMSLGIAFLPAVITVASGSNVANWIKSLIPSAGVGIISGMYNELCASISFLTIGSINVWTPYVILIAAVLYIPLFIILTIRAYCKHEH